MTKIDRIANLRARGMPASMIASLTGVDPSYISKLLKDEDFKYHVESLKTELAEAESATKDSQREEEEAYLGDRYAAAEHKLLDKLVDLTDYMTPRDASSALEAVGRRRVAQEDARIKRMVAENGGLLVGDNSTVNITRITIPAICAPDLVIAGNNEIVAIGDRSVAPMPSAKLKDMLGAKAPGGYVYEHRADDATAQA